MPYWGVHGMTCHGCPASSSLDKDLALDALKAESPKSGQAWLKQWWCFQVEGVKEVLDLSERDRQEFKLIMIFTFLGFNTLSDNTLPTLNKIFYTVKIYEACLIHTLYPRPSDSSYRQREGLQQIISVSFHRRYKMSKTCCPIFIVNSLCKDRQDRLDIQYCSTQKDVMY